MQLYLTELNEEELKHIMSIPGMLHMSVKSLQRRKHSIASAAISIKLDDADSVIATKIRSLHADKVYIAKAAIELSRISAMVDTPDNTPEIRELLNKLKG